MLNSHAALFGQGRTEVDFLLRKIPRAIRKESKTANELALYHDRDDQEGRQAFSLLYIMTIHPTVGGAILGKEKTLFFHGRHQFPRLGEALFDIGLR